MTRLDDPSPDTSSVTEAPRPGLPRRAAQGTVRLLPGLAVSAAATAASFGLNLLLPTVSVLLFAIVLGVLTRNLVPLPAAVEPGIKFSAKKLLRLGIVLLGLELVLGDVLDLGAGMIAVVIAIVAIGILGTLLLGRWMGIGFTQRLFIACGFSICGASAVAAVDGVVETEDEEEVVTAVGLTVIIGTLMIPAIPLLTAAFGLTAHQGGMWAGGAIQDVAQVVAAGGAIGGGALGVAVVVKLARVLMLAPVMASVSLYWRRRLRRAEAGAQAAHAKKPPLLPLFVAGFIVMVALRSTGIVPEGVLEVAKFAQTALLGAAMFALGTGVRIQAFRKVGLKPFALAACSTVLVSATALVGVLLAS